MRLTPEKRKEHYRTVYELLNKNSRIKVKDAARVLGLNRSAASNRMNEAFNLGYVTKPQVRLRSYKNTMEYTYFIRSKHPFRLFKNYVKDMNVVYHAKMGGFAHLWITSKEKMDITGDIVAEGYRSDYYVAHAPNHTWKDAIKVMQKKVETFNPDHYKPKGYIQTHWHEPIEWGAESEALFSYFKYDLRKDITPVMRKNLISARRVYEWLEQLPHSCTVFTRYFPNGIDSYDPYLFMLETDYEDFIIDLFSELPTSSFFFKVSDKLFSLTRVERKSLRSTALDMSEINQLYIPHMIDALEERGILKSEDHATVECHWKKEL